MKIQVLESRARRRIFGPRREEVIEGRRKLYCGEIHNLNSSGNTVRFIK
jgi:hypothetical protein